MTEPICAEMDKALTDMLVFDTTWVESYVAENNPKFAQAKARQAAAYAKIDPSFDPAVGRAAFMPEYAASNPAVKHQYINGHFCYAQEAAAVANGLGIVRHLELFDDDFKTAFRKPLSRSIPAEACLLLILASMTTALRCVPPMALPFYNRPTCVERSI